MPLPFLIGGAVLAIGTIIAAAVSDDSTPSSSNSNNSGADEERRRKEAATTEQRRREREEKRNNARTLFEEQGARIGDELREALDGLIHVIPLSNPAFTAKLGEADLAIPRSDEGRTHEVAHTLREAFFEEGDDVERIVESLEYHARVYDVQMITDRKFYQRLMALDDINMKLINLDGIESKLRTLQRGVMG